jgi:hypothetical protein
MGPAKILRLVAVILPGTWVMGHAKVVSDVKEGIMVSVAPHSLCPSNKLVSCCNDTEASSDECV